MSQRLLIVLSLSMFSSQFLDQATFILLWILLFSVTQFLKKPFGQNKSIRKIEFFSSGVQVLTLLIVEFLSGDYYSEIKNTILIIIATSINLLYLIFLLIKLMPGVIDIVFTSLNKIE